MGRRNKTTVAGRKNVFGFPRLLQDKVHSMAKGPHCVIKNYYREREDFSPGFTIQYIH